MIHPRVCALLLMLALSPAAQAAAPVTTSPWREVVVSVSNLERTARFFRNIGGYSLRDSGTLSASEVAAWGLPPAARASYQLLAPTGSTDGWIRLVDFDDAGEQAPMRPGARAWDSGCYFSLMVRVKDIGAVYTDAIELGWWTETPITYLEFGPSKLWVMIFRGPDGAYRPFWTVGGNRRNLRSAR